MDDLLAPRSIFPVHRLDREVSGLMVFAKDAQAAAHLSKPGNMEKEYLAVCAGCPDPAEGIMEDLLFHDRSRNKTYVVKKERKGVKPAKLAYWVLEPGQERSLVRVRLFTGRTHQIRVQFASRGYPLAGDRKYGGKTAEEIGLRSQKLRIRHPNGEWLSFEL